VIWVRITSALRRDARGRAVYDVSIVEDITDRKRPRNACSISHRTTTSRDCRIRECSAQLLDHAIPRSAQRHDRRCAVLFIISPVKIVTTRSA